MLSLTLLLAGATSPLAAAQRRPPDPALLARAESGDASAQWQLAEQYRNVELEPPDRFGEWRDRAAEGGSGAAQLSLSEAFHNGSAGVRDPQRSMDWLNRAVEGGHAPAQLRLALMYLHGDDGRVKQDTDAAMRLLQLALDNGETKAAGTLGGLLFERASTPEEKEAALKLVRAGARERDISSLRILFAERRKGNIVITDPAELELVLLMAVRDGDAQARAELAVRYYKGDGVPGNYPASLPLLRKSAEAGDFPSAECLVDEYQNEVKAYLKLGSNEKDPSLVKAREKLLAALTLYAVNGGPEHRVEAAKQLTRFRSTLDPEVRRKLKEEMPEDYLTALALVRVYRGEGGTNRQALDWLKAMEKHFKSAGKVTISGKTALQLIDEAEAELREKIRVRQQANPG